MTSSPKKAPGLDGIPFACLRQVYVAIPEHVNTFYLILGAKGYHPRSWREATTAIIPKTNKPDYSLVKAYCLIALLNCMGKILETLMATRLAQMVEAHHLLHPDQIGGRPQCSAINAAMALMHEIESNAGTKWVTSALFLDIRGAFDNVSAACLLHTMSQLGCLKAVLSWVKSFLANRTTALSFDSHTDIQRPINMGILQGSLASPILFLLYLHPLFDALKTAHPTLWAPSYINDITLVTHGRTCEDNARALEKATRTAFKWADENAVALDDSKSDMLYFHHACQDTTPDTINITLPNAMIVKPGT
jgi:hypothetical protein